MLHLPQVSVLAIDTVHPHKTLAAIEYSVRHVKFAEIIFLTDLSRFPNLPQTVTYKVPIRYVHHEESDRRVKYAQRMVPIDYELAAMQLPAMYVQTPFMQRIEWDSAVVNHEAWDNGWLRFDFCGAPWSRHHDPGFPECDGETNAVGNAGFSLQSQKYMKAVREATFLFQNDPEIGPKMVNSDAWPCRVIRPWLEHERGIKFAPVEVAARYSCENRIYTSQWGLHGRNSVLMQNWSGPFWGTIRP